MLIDSYILKLFQDITKLKLFKDLKAIQSYSKISQSYYKAIQRYHKAITKLFKDITLSNQTTKNQQDPTAKTYCSPKLQTTKPYLPKYSWTADLEF